MQPLTVYVTPRGLWNMQNGLFPLPREMCRKVAWAAGRLIGNGLSGDPTMLIRLLNFMLEEAFDTAMQHSLYHYLRGALTSGASALLWLYPPPHDFDPGGGTPVGRPPLPRGSLRFRAANNGGG